MAYMAAQPPFDQLQPPVPVDRPNQKRKAKVGPVVQGGQEHRVEGLCLDLCSSQLLPCVLSLGGEDGHKVF